MKPISLMLGKVTEEGPREAPEETMEELSLCYQEKISSSKKNQTRKSSQQKKKRKREKIPRVLGGQELLR